MDAYCLDRLVTRLRCMLVIGSSTPSLLAWAPNLYAITRSLTSETRLSYQSQTISVLTIAIGCLTPRSNARPFCIKLLVVAPKSNQTTLLPPFSYPSSSLLLWLPIIDSVSFQRWPLAQTSTHRSSVSN